MNESGLSANIRTTRTFEDFKLHIEYNCPNDGNSESTYAGALRNPGRVREAGHRRQVSRHGVHLRIHRSGS